MKNIFKKKNVIQNSDQKVVFVIPLISSKVSKNWGSVLAHLDNTIRSILCQTDNRFQIIIVSHDALNGLIINHPSIINLVVDFRVPVTLKEADGDKRKKMHYAGIWMKNNKYDGDYVFHFDADDLVSKYTVSDIFSGKCDAYIVTKGYVWDISNKSTHIIEKRFFQYCGSCFVTTVANDEFPETLSGSDTYYSHTCGRHDARGSIALAYGKSVGNFDRANVMYLINNNISLQNNKFGERKNFRGLPKYDPMPIVTTIFSQTQYIDPNHHKLSKLM